jgi:hypothetical protein
MEHRLSGILQKALAFDKTQMPRIATQVESPSFIEDMPAETYHADRTRMSSTAIRKLLHSPRHFLTYWQGLEEAEEEPDHFRIGRAAHMFLLEPRRFKELYVLEPEFIGYTKDGRESKLSKEAKEMRQAWRKDQDPEAIIVSSDELTMLIGMIEAVLEHPVASKMLENGKPECTIHWTDKETMVMCKARPDYVVQDPDGNIHLIDFKTTRDIRPGIFSYDVMKLGYNVQLAYYHDGLMEALKRQPQTITLIPAEKKQPWEAAVYPLSDKFFEEGQEDYKTALRLYRKCMDLGKWPAYSSTAAVLEAPNEINYRIRKEYNWED